MGRVARMEERRGACRVSVGKYEGKKPLVRPRRGREYHTKMDLKGVRWEVMNSIDLAQVRDRWWALVNAVMNLRVP